jgi:integrase
MATRELVKLNDGSTRYKYKIRRKLPDGRILTRVKQFRTDKAGQRWARSLEAELDAGKAVPTLTDAQRTFADLSARYRLEALPGYDAKERKLRSTRLDWWEARLGATPLIALRRPLLMEHLAALERGEGTPRGPVGPATRNRYIGVLRHVLGTAVRWEWLEHNPASRLSRPKIDQEPPGRARYLDDDERERLLVACEAEDSLILAPLVKLALLTGCRRGELLGLRWGDVDWHRRQFSLIGDDGKRRTKNRQGRSVALSASALAVLRDLSQVRKIGCDLVFSNGDGQVTVPRPAFNRALRRAEIQDFRFHDLRHTFASYLLMSGASLAELAEALGHKTLAMVKRYSHLSRAHAASVVDRMDARLMGGGFG